jgi:Rab-GTPase-TBC domain
MGEDSSLFQQQLYQHNYVEWFQPKDVTIAPSKNIEATTSAVFVECPTDDDDDNNGIIHRPILQSSSNNLMMTSTSDLLQDFAPVSSKWSDCQSAQGDELDAKAKNIPLSHIQNHVIDLVLLRKLVSVGYGLDDNDDDDDDHEDDADDDPNDHLGSQSESPKEIHRATRTTAVSRMHQTKKGYRAMAWRVLLGFLPLETNQWLLHATFTKANTTTEKNDDQVNANAEEEDDDDDEDIKEVNTSGLSTDTNNDNKTMVQQHRELYISLVQELFVSVEDVTTMQAMELCSRKKNSHKKNQYGRPPNKHNIRDNDTSMSSNFSRTSSSSSLFSINDHVDVTSAQNTDSNDTDPIELNAAANIVSTQLQQYWKKKSLDPYILQRCCVTNNNNNVRSSSNLNILRIQNDDHYWNNENVGKDGTAATTTNAVSSDEDSINMIKQDNLQDFVDNVLLLDEIRKDVIRTHPDLAFFLDPTVGVRRYAAIERILFVWSKYNKGVRYVQGMNEIVGILYYVLANDQNDEWSIWAEADTFWLFNALIGGDDMRDVFISGFDEHDTGIHGRLITMQQLLQRHDPEVSEHLQELGIEISFYAIRWWTTLLCREFLLPDTIRLWDSMFASTHKDNFLRYVCVIMVMSIRDRLLKGDFTVCLQLLHDFPSTSVDQLLEASRALWIYESQISVACHRGGLTLHQALTTIESPKALIMAFGFVNGTPPPPVSILKNPIVDDIKTASVQIEATVRRSAHMFLGRAKGWYNRYNNSNTADDDCKEQGNNSTSKAPAEEDTQQDNPAELVNEADDVYMKAFLET